LIKFIIPSRANSPIRPSALTAITVSPAQAKGMCRISLYLVTECLTTLPLDYTLSVNFSLGYEYLLT